jgi:nitrile hydratase subunit alpha
MTEHDSAKVQQIHRELHSHLPPEPALRVKALETLLVEKGMVDSRTVDAWIDVYTEDIGPKRGAQIVARAWTDPAFKRRLLANASEAIAEFGLGHAHLKVVENTAEVHNLVVCTLCSCYPLSVIGIAPAWYKMAAYRARAVRDPRGVLEEFGVRLPESVEVRVRDSTAELRYMVLPQRPPGTDGWSEERLARLVTRNAMIGTERDLAPRIAEVR